MNEEYRQIAEQTTDRIDNTLTEYSVGVVIIFILIVATIGGIISLFKPNGK